MKKSVKILLIALCVIFVGIFIYSGYTLISKMHEYKVAENTYDSLSNQYVSTSPKPTSEIEEETDDEEYIDPEVSPISVDFDSLQEQCSDIVGWIYSPDTVINYPITQCDDNMYYLHRLINGNYNSSGTLFIECLCPKGFAADNTIIYGHHMNDGSMFASLVNYAQQSYYEAHPVMYISTPDKNYRLDIFAGYVTEATSDTYQINFENDEDYQEYLNLMKDQSKFSAEVNVSPDDKIVTLSTCTYDYDDARFVVQAKLTRIH